MHKTDLAKKYKVLLQFETFWAVNINHSLTLGMSRIYSFQVYSFPEGPKFYSS